MPTSDSSAPLGERPLPSVLGFAGLAKNSGKTTALGAWIRSEPKARIGVVSIGVDGEARDLFRGHAKPTIALPAGGLALSAARALRAEEGAWDVLELLDRRSVLGELVLLRARRASNLVLAGVRHSDDLRAAIEALQRHGAERVLVDGALQRRIVADPGIVDAAVLCTGHVLGDTLRDVVDETVTAVKRWSLPAPAELPVVALETLLGHAEQIGAPRAGEWRLDLDGALTRRGALTVSGLPNPPRQLVLRHGGHDHLDNDARLRLKSAGVELAAATQVKIAAVAINPVHPAGGRLDSAKLKATLSDALDGLPVYDPLLDLNPLLGR